MVLVPALPSSPSPCHPPPPSALGRGQYRVRRRSLLLAGLGDPLLETSKLFIAEPSKGGRPERSQGAPEAISPVTEFTGTPGVCGAGLVFYSG